MNIVFRVDSSQAIGSGHLMRCLSLAARLKKEYKANIFFICRDLVGNMAKLVADNGYELIVLPKAEPVEGLQGYARWLTVSKEYDAKECVAVLLSHGLSVDKLVIDSYALDIEWESLLRPYTKEIFVIDDLANRKHECDYLLDQNLYEDMYSRYNGLVPENCKLLLGPKYALLREEFYVAEKHKRIRDGSIKNILVFFGGVDLTNETAKTLKAIELLDRTDLVVNVVVGASNPYKDDIKAMCDNHDGWNYLCQVNNMAELMNEADLAIGAGGSTTWERCFLGLPALVIAVAENQVDGCNYLQEQGLIKYLGLAEDVDCFTIKKAVSSYGLVDLDAYKVALRKYYGG